MRLPSSSAGMGRRQREEIVRARRLRRCIVASLGIVALAPILLLGPSLAWRSSRAHLALSESATAALADDFDAIVVPGGGLMADGEPPPWVVARLDKCLELWTLNPGARVVVLSRGTPHKPPPLDADGRPIDEAAVSADYLRARGVPSEQLLQDTWSLDTIGNAFFLRLMHLEPRGLRRIVVITNAFHSPRVQAIFEWVLRLPPTPLRFQTRYVDADDVGLTAEQLDTRRRKEAESVRALQRTIEAHVTVAALHGFVFERHGAYATGIARTPVSRELAASY